MMDQCCAPQADPGDTKFRLILWVALVLNAGMFLVEITAGIFANSVALQADGIDFLSDSANYAISLFVLGMSLRARALAALIKAGSMGLFGVWVLASAAYYILTGAMPQPLVMGPVALLALAVNVAVALLLYAHRNGDSNRQSIWLCSRNDAIGNVAVFAAAGLIWITYSPWPDILVALAMAGLALHSARAIWDQARAELKQVAATTPAPAK